MEREALRHDNTALQGTITRLERELSDALEDCRTAEQRARVESDKVSVIQGQLSDAYPCLYHNL